MNGLNKITHLLILILIGIASFAFLFTRPKSVVKDVAQTVQESKPDSVKASKEAAHKLSRDSEKLLVSLQAKLIASASKNELLKEIAEQTAKWVGECRNGHRHYRFKSPKGQLSCLYCGRGFNPRNLISWTKRAA